MIKFLLQILHLPDNRLVKAAHNNLLKSSKKARWPKQIKATLEEAGFSWAWNNDQGPRCKPNDFLGMLDLVLYHQEIKVAYDFITRLK